MARWLVEAGFARVAVLEGGLPAWRAQGLPTETRFVSPAGARAAAEAPAASPLPSLLDRYLADGALPARVRLATLFVDIAGSTRLLAHHPAESVLGFVQRFMRLVTEVALAYCGDVKDFEGDGALLYFESAADAASAALAIREALAGGSECGGPACPVAARLSLSVGDVVVGLVGSATRRGLAIVGPSVHIGARLLKQIEPGGIIATGEVVEALRAEAPELAARCRLLEPAWEVPGAEGLTVATWRVE